MRNSSSLEHETEFPGWPPDTIATDLLEKWISGIRDRGKAWRIAWKSGTRLNELQGEARFPDLFF